MNEARITHLVHDVWEARAFPCEFLSRYAHCVYHNLALGRGPLRAIVFRDANDADLRQCRHGCAAEETLEHVLCDCRYVEDQRCCLELELRDLGLAFSLKTAFAVQEVSLACEKLIAKFLNSWNS